MTFTASSPFFILSMLTLLLPIFVVGTIAFHIPQGATSFICLVLGCVLVTYSLAEFIG